MRIDLTGTNASQVTSSLLQARRQAGSPSMGMVLTLVVVTDEAHHGEALRSAREVSTEHPARILGVIRGPARGKSRLDAEVTIGDGTSGETALLRLSGELTRHPVSVVTPLLLADSPVVVWWPNDAPDDPAGDPLGRLAQRRITDCANSRRRSTAMAGQAQHHTAGNTDLSWTRLTPWRALLAAGLDQHPVRVTSATVEAKTPNPSADLLAAWLGSRLEVPVETRRSGGPGITAARLHSSHGDISLDRPDGRLATFRIPGEADRPVALQRRSTAELLAEELRRLDNDDIYQQTVLAYARSQQPPAKGKRSTGTKTTGTKTTGKTTGTKTTGKTTGTKTATKPRTGSTRRRRT
jgi:glucose-6-phosphate dehydrogenase assembly protein OpcA